MFRLDDAAFQNLSSLGLKCNPETADCNITAIEDLDILKCLGTKIKESDEWFQYMDDTIEFVDDLQDLADDSKENAEQVRK